MSGLKPCPKCRTCGTPVPLPQCTDCAEIGFENTRAEPKYITQLRKEFHDDIRGQRALELLRYMTDNWENSGEDLRHVTMLPISVGWYKEAKALLEVSDEQHPKP